MSARGKQVDLRLLDALLDIATDGSYGKRAYALLGSLKNKQASLFDSTILHLIREREREELLLRIRKNNMEVLNGLDETRKSKLLWDSRKVRSELTLEDILNGKEDKILNALQKDIQELDDAIRKRKELLSEVDDFEERRRKLTRSLFASRRDKLKKLSMRDLQGVNRFVLRMQLDEEWKKIRNDLKLARKDTDPFYGIPSEAVTIYLKRIAIPDANPQKPWFYKDAYNLSSSKDGQLYDENVRHWEKEFPARWYEV